jgi:hypothetical protein
MVSEAHTGRGMLRKIGPVLGRIGLVLGGLVATLLVAELALRVLGVSYPSFYAPDDDLGNVLRPGAEGWYRQEGSAYVVINSAGMRDREHTFDKPANTLRIAFLGDSFTEAMQVPMEQTFWSVAEKQLASCPAVNGRTVEALNFGVAGYGTAQELLMLRHRVWQYHPDIVVLDFLSGNDVTDNSRVLRQAQQMPYFYHKDGQLLLDNSFRNDPAFLERKTASGQTYQWMLNHSSILQLYQYVRQKLKQAGRGQYEGGLLDGVYKEPTDDDWIEAWKITEELILMMRDEVASKGAKFLFVMLSNPIQANPDRAQREAFMKRVGVETLFYPEERLGGLTSRNNIPSLFLAPSLQKYADEHQVYLHGFGANLGSGHWNENGHRVAGELIAQKLCSDIIPR